MNYIIRHWKGDLPLAVSFWVNISLMNLIIVAAMNWLSTSEYWNTNYVGTARFTIISVLVVFFLWVWQIVGTWRSAQNHIAVTKRRLWARNAQIIIVLGMIGIAINLQTGRRVYIEIAKISFGFDPYSKYDIILSENGNDVTIHGGIGFGISIEVEKIINKNPDITIIKLTSFGGRLLPARQLRNLIHKNNLNTYAEGRCNSACSFVFLAGGNRIFGTNARLGFHAAQFPRLSQEIMDTELELDRKFLLQVGLPNEFVEKVLDTAPGGMWYPTVEELFEANVITHYYDGTELLGESTYKNR